MKHEAVQAASEQHEADGAERVGGVAVGEPAGDRGEDRESDRPRCQQKSDLRGAVTEPFDFEG